MTKWSLCIAYRRAHSHCGNAKMPEDKPAMAGRQALVAKTAAVRLRCAHSFLRNFGEKTEEKIGKGKISLLSLAQPSKSSERLDLSVFPWHENEKLKMESHFRFFHFGKSEQQHAESNEVVNKTEMYYRIIPLAFHHT